MSDDVSRRAAVAAALDLVEPGMTIGLGSGRAVFALIEAIGTRGTLHALHALHAPLRAAVASEETRVRATAAGIDVVDLHDHPQLDIALDGADEIDSNLALLKGGGAALLREKLVATAAKRLVIIAEAAKQVQRLGETRSLPVEVVRFGWTTTRDRLIAITERAVRRESSDGVPIVTDEGHFLIDVPVPAEVAEDAEDLGKFAARLKATLGVVDHGLFLDQAGSVILGEPDGGTVVLEREQLFL